MTFIYPEASADNDGTVGFGPAPYFHRSDCNICRQQDGVKTGSGLLDGPRPSGHIFEDEHFLVEHAPLKSSSPGTVIVQATRHLLDFGDMEPDEIAGFGPLMHRLVPAVKPATGVKRVYYLALMERAAHFHLWLVPKKDEGDLVGMAYMAQQPPLTASLTDAEAMSKKIRTELKSS